MGLVDRLKARLVRNKVEDVLGPYDTEEERRAMADTEIKAGMHPMLANGLAFLGGVFQEALTSVLTSKDFVSLLGDPGTLLRMLLAAILIRLAFKVVPPGTTTLQIPNQDKKP